MARLVSGLAAPSAARHAAEVAAISGNTAVADEFWKSVQELQAKALEKPVIPASASARVAAATRSILAVEPVKVSSVAHEFPLWGLALWPSMDTREGSRRKRPYQVQEQKQSHGGSRRKRAIFNAKINSQIGVFTGQCACSS